MGGGDEVAYAMMSLYLLKTDHLGGENVGGGGGGGGGSGKENICFVPPPN